MNSCKLILFLVVAIILGYPMQAEAYIDPSATSYAVQAIAGAVIALSVVIGVVWRRVKKGTAKVLKIDENSNKEQEDDGQLIDSERSAK